MSWLPVADLPVRAGEPVTICEALAREEGFNIPGSRAQRNHNPGNINYGSFAQMHGSTRIEELPHGTPRFAYFPDAEAGFAAMKALLQAHYGGMTVRQMLMKYAPPSDSNDTESYIRNVCAWTGLTAETEIDNYL